MTNGKDEGDSERNLPYFVDGYILRLTMKGNTAVCKKAEEARKEAFLLPFICAYLIGGFCDASLMNSEASSFAPQILPA